MCVEECAFLLTCACPVICFFLPAFVARIIEAGLWTIHAERDERVNGAMGMARKREEDLLKEGWGG